MGFGVAGDVADEFCIAQRIRRHVSLTLRKRGSYFRHAYRFDLDGKLLAVADVAANAGGMTWWGSGFIPVADFATPSLHDTKPMISMDAWQWRGGAADMRKLRTNR